MYIYALTSRMSLTAIELRHKVDLYKLLGGQEVLSFGFDDYTEDEAEICVQAKDLHLYLINFYEQTVVRRLERPHNIVLKSVFYPLADRDNKLKEYEHVKELIEHEESVGNKVLLPKINDHMVAIQRKDTNFIELYELHQ